MMLLVAKLSSFFLALFMLFLSVSYAFTFYKATVSASWETATATLTQYERYAVNKYVSGQKPEGPESDTGTYLKVQYEFDVNGEDYFGDAVDVKQKEFFLDTPRGKYLKLNVGDEILVKYNSKDPSKNYMWTIKHINLSGVFFKFSLYTSLFVLFLWVFKKV